MTQKLGLHQSDSGADLSEYHDQHEAKSIQNLVASYGKTFQTTETEIENNYENVDMLTEYKQIPGNYLIKNFQKTILSFVIIYLIKRTNILCI